MSNYVLDQNAEVPRPQNRASNTNSKASLAFIASATSDPSSSPSTSGSTSPSNPVTPEAKTEQHPSIDQRVHESTGTTKRTIERALKHFTKRNREEGPQVGMHGAREKRKLACMGYERKNRKKKKNCVPVVFLCPESNHLMKVLDLDEASCCGSRDLYPNFLLPILLSRVRSIASPKLIISSLSGPHRPRPVLERLFHKLECAYLPVNFTMIKIENY